MPSEKLRKDALTQLVHSNGWEFVKEILKNEVEREQNKIMVAKNFNEVLEARAKIRCYGKITDLEFYNK